MLIKLLKLFLSLLGLILLGALGSGLWEKVLNPFIDWFSKTFITIIGNFQSSYIDNIYKSSALGPEKVSLMFSAVFFLVIFSFIMYALFIYINRTFRNGNSAFILKFMVTTQLAGTFILIGILLVRFPTVSSLSNYSYQGLEIVRPNMSEYQYYELKSELLQVMSKDDFLNFSKKLKSYEDDEHRLPELVDL